MPHSRTAVLLCLAMSLLSATLIASTPQDGGAFRPLIGLWRAGVDGPDTTWTIDGTAAPKPNDEQIRTHFGASAPVFLGGAKSPTIFPLAVAHGMPVFTEGRLSVDFKLLAGATDQTAGVMFNLRDDHSYLYARYNTKDGNVAVWKYEKGERTALAHGDVHRQLAFGQWHTLTVDVTGRQVRASVGDLTVVHALDRDLSGGVGLWSKPDSVTAFRRFSAKGR